MVFTEWENYGGIVMGLFNKKELKRIAELEQQINILQTELNENQKFMMDNHITDCQSAEN